MKTKIFLFAFAILFTGMLTSCSIDDDYIENPAYATGGDEIDDPVEPDEDN